MPCTGGCNSPTVPVTDATLSDLRAQYVTLLKDFGTVRAERDEATMLLCQILKSANNATGSVDFNGYSEKSRLIVWWEQHKNLDSKRKLEELRTKKKKLSAEIKALESKLNPKKKKR